MGSHWAFRLRSNRTPPWSDAHEDEPQGKSSCVVFYIASIHLDEWRFHVNLILLNVFQANSSGL